MRTVHDLKIHPHWFESVHSGEKPFELRRNDKGFAAGDVLALREWDPVRRRYTGRKVLRKITCVLCDACGLAPDFVILGLSDDIRPHNVVSDLPES